MSTMRIATWLTMSSTNDPTESGVPIFSMFIDAPDRAEQKLGEYVLDTLADGKELTQALADQRGWTWSLVAGRVPRNNDGYSLRADNQHDGRRVRLR
jgi:hypothetical protein